MYPKSSLHTWKSNYPIRNYFAEDSGNLDCDLKAD